MLLKKWRTIGRRKSAGKYPTSNCRGFLPLDKSQGKHPKPPVRPQIPVDADWTSSSAIFTVCRRIDLSMRERLVPPRARRESRAWPRPTSMRAYKSRQSRIPGGGLSRRRPREEWWQSPRGCSACEGSFVSARVGDSACKWSTFIVRRERPVWICEVENETKVERERKRDKRPKDNGGSEMRRQSVPGKAEIAEVSRNDATST